MRTILVLLCVFITIAGCSKTNEGPTDSFKTYIENLQKKEFSKVNNVLDIESIAIVNKNGGLQLVTAEAVKFIEQHKLVKSVNFTDVVITNDKATAKAIITYNDGVSTAPINTEYIQENGKWKYKFIK